MFRDHRGHTYTLKCTQFGVCSITCVNHSSCCAQVVPWGWSTSGSQQLHAPAQLCGTEPSKAWPHPLGILCTARPFSGAQSTVGALSFTFPSPWPEIRAAHGRWSQPRCCGPHYRLGPLSEAGDKPRNSPQPFLMGQLEPSPRENNEGLWLEQGASRTATHTALGRKLTVSPCSGRIPPYLLLGPTQHLSPASAPCSCLPPLCCPRRAGWQLSRGAVPKARAGTARGEAGGVRRLWAAQRQLQNIARHKYECAHSVTMPEGRVNI